MNNSSLPTVVIPVFNAYDCTLACLESVARYSPDASVLIIDDASDDPRVAPALRAWVSASQRGRLIELKNNGGFVRAANLGANETAGDIVLLNSDTEVTKGWLEALGRCLESDRLIATATPWSNNAEIVSWPDFCTANPVPAHPELIAAAVARASHRAYPELPTAVGFCMGVTRRSIDAIGLFDAETFGRGYGEENDFSLRAVQAGFKNVLCDDAYVIHVGGQSFGPIGLKPDDASMQRLLSRHPDYLDHVMHWIEKDPLNVYRTAISTAFKQA